MVYRYLALFTALTLFTATVGCTPPSAPSTEADHHEHEHDHDHDHADMPTTYAEAVAQIEAMRNQIRDGFANDDIDSAHDPLHEIGHILEHLGELAEKEADVDAEAVKQDADELFEHFGAVDETLHGHEGKSYDEVSEQIDAAVERLKSHLPGETQPADSAAAVPEPTEQSPSAE